MLAFLAALLIIAVGLIIICPEVEGAWDIDIQADQPDNEDNDQ